LGLDAVKRFEGLLRCGARGVFVRAVYRDVENGAHGRLGEFIIHRALERGRINQEENYRRNYETRERFSFSVQMKPLLIKRNNIL
ncbi:MAG: hypothetical protein ACD_59C00044G0005, partial [uncultured bacterium]